jgi:hypothetical protein
MPHADSPVLEEVIGCETQFLDPRVRASAEELTVLLPQP